MQQCGKHQAKHTSASPLLTGWQNIITYRQQSKLSYVICHLSSLVRMGMLIVSINVFTQ